MGKSLDGTYSMPAMSPEARILYHVVQAYLTRYPPPPEGISMRELQQAIDGEGTHPSSTHHYYGEVLRALGYISRQTQVTLKDHPRQPKRVMRRWVKGTK